MRESQHTYDILYRCLGIAIGVNTEIDTFHWLDTTGTRSPSASSTIRNHTAPAPFSSIGHMEDEP